MAGLQKPGAGNERWKYLEFFRQFFTITEDMIQADDNVALYCPEYFHVSRRGHPQEDAPKYYVNLNTGGGICHTCKVTHTDAEGFLMEKEGISFGEAKKWIEEVYIEPIGEDIVDRLHATLLGQQMVMGFLHREKCLTEETIRKFRLGFDGERICTPIPGGGDRILNIRKYLKGAKRNKVISWAKGYGRTRIFPIRNLLDRGPSQRLVLFGGEFKTIAADQVSRTVPPEVQWASITTAGEGALPPYVLRFLVEKVKLGDPVLYICYDIDHAGRIAAQRLANKLIPLGVECRDVRLPITQPANGDFNDYIRQGGSAEQFLQLLDNAEVFHVEQAEEQQQTTVEAIKAHLSETSQTHLAGKKIETEVVVAGKDLSPYILPKTVQYRCKMEWGEKCEGCGLMPFEGDRTITLDGADPSILNLVGVTDKEVQARLREKVHIVPKCAFVRIEAKESMNIEEVLLIPELDFSAEDREYVTRTAYHVGHGLRANRAYSLKALSTPDPRTQHATLLIYDVEDGKTNLQQFQMTQELFDQLKIFQGDPEDVFNRVAKDLSHNVTRIYGRDIIAKATDFIFHSALQFNFMGKLIHKGCVEGLFFGDTRTGKSETIKNMHLHYRLGEFMDCGNTTFAGLVGGMQQTGGKRWQVTWGKIPLNNGGLVTLDEVSSLDIEHIGDMTGIRSSGIAEIIKIQTERTQAMVRMAWISNPRQMNMTLGKYNYGIQGVQELIGRPEDVARFDFVVAVAFEENLDKVINTSQHEGVPHEFTSDLCHNLILWTWTRKAEHVVFTEEATASCLEWASKMGQDFSSQFPIVISADQRIKLARLAVAAACRTFSTSDGEQVLVERRHVDYAVKFLYEAYDDPALGYADYSKQQNYNKDKATSNMPAILNWMRTKKDICETILEFPMSFKTLDLMDMMALDKDEARNILAFLKKNGLISAGGGASYRKEGHLIDILRNPRKFCEQNGMSWDGEPENKGFKGV
jgi:hypothetical protein